MPRKWDSRSNLDRLGFLGIVELRDLLQDEEKINQIIRFQELQRHKGIMLASNRRLADQNLSHRPCLNEGKLLLAERYQELGSLSNATGHKQNQLEAFLQRCSPQTTQWLLQEKVAQAQDESEELLHAFMEGRLLLEGFMESFQSSRKVYHIRLVQAEKLHDLRRHVKEPQRATKVPCIEPAFNCARFQEPPNAMNIFYGLTPAIILSNFHYPFNTPSVHIPYLPPLDCQLGHSWRPTASHLDSSYPHGIKVCRQAPRWPVRPARLQQLNRQPNNNPQGPPY